MLSKSQWDAVGGVRWVDGGRVQVARIARVESAPGYRGHRRPPGQRQVYNTTTSNSSDARGYRAKKSVRASCEPWGSRCRNLRIFLFGVTEYASFIHHGVARFMQKGAARKQDAMLQLRTCFESPQVHVLCEKVWDLIPRGHRAPALAAYRHQHPWIDLLSWKYASFHCVRLCISLQSKTCLAYTRNFSACICFSHKVNQLRKYQSGFRQLRRRARLSALNSESF